MGGDALKALAAEIVSEEEFDALVERARAARSAAGDAARASGDLRPPKAYIGFEPSGTAHVGWFVCTQTINELVDAGFEVTILLADWHAKINDKLGGDLRAIRACGEYMKDAFEALGVRRDSVRYRWAQDLVRNHGYWSTVVRVAKATSMARVRRAMDIMGRSADEGDKDFSKFLYPAMQVADIFYMRVDLAYGGLDQRHAHMLARDVAKKLGERAPVALHTPLVSSLRGGRGRMDPENTPKIETLPAHNITATSADMGAKISKSDPSSGIFLHDTADDVKAKIRKAHCPAGEADDNPVLDLLRLVVFPRLQDGLLIDRPDKFGGPLHFDSFDAVRSAFEAGDLHPQDLKSGVADAMNTILEPVRAYFEEHPKSLETVRAAMAAT